MPLQRSLQHALPDKSGVPSASNHPNALNG